LELISGTFGTNNNRTGAGDGTEDDSQASPSPLKHTYKSGKSSDGMFSNSTNNLEKAYEDLEKEIMDIKHKLQSSVNSGAAPTEQNSQIATLQNYRSSGDNSSVAYYAPASVERDQSVALSSSVAPPTATRGAPQGHATNYAPLRSVGRSPNRSSGTRSGMQQTGNPGGADLEEHDYSLSVSDLNSTSFYRSAKHE